MALTVRELLTRLGVQTDVPAVKRFDQAVSDTKRTMGQANVAAGGLTQQIKTLAGAYLGLQAVGLAARSLLNVNVEVQRLRASLEVATGSVENAEKAFDRIAEFTKATPFQLNQVATAFIKLSNLGLDPSEKALTSYGNTAASMGFELNQMIEAVADATTGEFERLKEFGIKAKSQGDKVSFTFRKVTTTVGKNAEEIEAYLRGIGETQFAGAMEKQMDTLGGQLSNLRDNLFLFQLRVGEAGVNAALKELFETLLGVTAGSGDFADMVGRVLAAAIRALTKAIRFLIEHAEELKLVLQALVALFIVKRIQAFSSAILGAAQAVRALGIAATLPAIKLALIAAAVALVFLAVNDLIVFMKGGDSLIGRFLARFGGAPGLMGSVARGVRRLIEGVVGLVRRAIPVVVGVIKTLTPVAKELFAFVIDLALQWFALTTQLFETIAPIVADLARMILGLVMRIAPMIFGLVQSLVPVVMTLIAMIMRAVGMILPVIVELIGVVLGLVQDLWPEISTLLEDVLDLVLDIVDAILPIVLELIDLIVPQIKLVWEITAQVLKAILKLAVPIIKVIIAQIKIAVKFFVGVIDFILTVWEFFKDIFVAIWETVGEPILAVWDVIKGAIIGVISFVVNLFNSVIETILSVVNGLIETVNEAAEFLGIDTISTFSAESLTLSLPEEPKRPDLSVGEVKVDIQGSTGMGPEEVSRATQSGLAQALREADRAAG